MLFVEFFETIVLNFVKKVKQLNLFRNPKEQTEENAQQQKLTTRVYFMLLTGRS